MHGQAVQPPRTVAVAQSGALWRINKAVARA